MENKIVNVTLTGGLIGFLVGSPMNALNKAIGKVNQQGWEVVQIIPAGSGNLFLTVLKIVILIVTFFLFTIGTGYYVVLQRPTISPSAGSMNSANQEPEVIEEDVTEGLFD